MLVTYISASNDDISKAEIYIRRFLLMCVADGVSCDNRFLSNSGSSYIGGRLILPSKQHRPDTSPGHFLAQQYVQFLKLFPICTLGSLL